MPQYEFKCSVCGNTAETSVLDEEHPLYCMNLESHEQAVQMNRVYQIGGIVLKGTGFYRTDSKRLEG